MHPAEVGGEPGQGEHPGPRVVDVGGEHGVEADCRPQLRAPGQAFPLEVVAVEGEGRVAEQGRDRLAVSGEGHPPAARTALRGDGDPQGGAGAGRARCHRAQRDPARGCDRLDHRGELGVAVHHHHVARGLRRPLEAELRLTGRTRDRRRAVAERLAEPGQQGAELQAVEERVHRRLVIAAHPGAAEVEGDVEVGLDGGHPLAEPGLLGVLGEGGLEPARFHARDGVEDRLEGAVIVDERHGGLLAHAGDTRDVVAGVALEGLVVGHQGGSKPKRWRTASTS